MRIADRSFSTAFSLRFNIIVYLNKVVCTSAIDGLRQVSSGSGNVLRSVNRGASPRRYGAKASVTMSKLCSILPYYCLSIYNLMVMKRERIMFWVHQFRYVANMTWLYALFFILNMNNFFSYCLALKILEN